MEIAEDEPHAFDRLVLLAFRNPMDDSDPALIKKIQYGLYLPSSVM